MGLPQIKFTSKVSKLRAKEEQLGEKEICQLARKAKSIVLNRNKIANRKNIVYV